MDGRYRPEHLCELRLCLTMWEHYQEAIADLDRIIAEQLPDQPPVRHRDDDARHVAFP